MASVTIEQQVQQICDALVPVVQAITDALVPVVQAITDALVPVVQAITDAFVPVVQRAAEELNRLWEAVLKSYPNKRIVHLAFHGKTTRIRKKNRNRIFRDYIKAVKRDG